MARSPFPAQANDLPGHTYDAYLGAAWRPQFSPMWGADLAVSAGAYSDFSRVTWQSVRVMGRGLGVVTLSPQWRAELGVVYLDRLSIKLLPAGGLIWTPNPDVRFDFVFPYPKFAERISNVGNYEVWAYLRGEYGGGQWSVIHVNGTFERRQLQRLAGDSGPGVVRQHSSSRQCRARLRVRSQHPVSLRVRRISIPATRWSSRGILRSKRKPFRREGEASAELLGYAIDRTTRLGRSLALPGIPVPLAARVDRHSYNDQAVFGRRRPTSALRETVLMPGSSRQRFRDFVQELRRRGAGIRSSAGAGSTNGSASNGSASDGRPQHRSFWQLFWQFWKLLGRRRRYIGMSLATVTVASLLAAGAAGRHQADG